MHYKYNRYYSHCAPKIVKVFSTHTYTRLTHTKSFNISIQYNHNITAQTTNNTHKAVNQATKSMGSRPVTYRAVGQWLIVGSRYCNVVFSTPKVHFLLFSKKKSTFYFTRFLMWHSLVLSLHFLSFLFSFSLYFFLLFSISSLF